MEDFTSLLPNQLISDLIIDAFLDLLNSNRLAEVNRYKFVHCQIVNNFLNFEEYIPELEFNIQNYNRVFFPVNIGNYHWILVVINNGKKEVEYYDSLYKLKSRFREEDNVRPEIKEKFLQKLPFIADWNWSYKKRGIAQQKKGVDCGVFVMGYCYKSLQNQSLKFVDKVNDMDKTMNRWRNVIGNSIIQNKLLDLK